MVVRGILRKRIFECLFRKLRFAVPHRRVAERLGSGPWIRRWLCVCKPPLAFCCFRKLLQTFIHALFSDTDVSFQLGFGYCISGRILPLFAFL